MITRIFLLLFLLLLFASCASDRELTVETKSEIASIPLMNQEDLAYFIAALIQNSKLSDAEKIKLANGIEIYIQELAAIKLTQRQAFIAYLLNLNKPDSNTTKELEYVVYELHDQQSKAHINLFKYIGDKLKGQISKESIQGLYNEFSRNPAQLKEDEHSI